MNSIDPIVLKEFQVQVVSRAVELGMKAHADVEANEDGVPTIRLTLDVRDLPRSSGKLLVDKFIDICSDTAAKTDLVLTIVRSRKPSKAGIYGLSILLENMQNFIISSHSAILDKYYQEFERSVANEVTNQRRPKRQKHELPDPNKPPSAAVNRYDRPTQQFNSAIDPKLVERVRSASKATGKTKREIVEAALDQYLSELDRS
ncbi:MAG: hypothetical protein ACSHXB_17595 [Sulfitobacter sp.]